MRASFRLNELLSVDDSVEQERENLSAPSVKLMRTVSAAIREDLGKVKDVLDIYVRRGGQPAELERRSACCARSATRSACWASANCASWSSKKPPAGSHGRRQDAGGSRRAGAHRRHAHQCRGPPRSRSHRTHRSQGTGRGRAESVDVDFQQVQAAVLRECSVNLVRVKEAIASNVAGTLDVGALDAWPGSSPASRPDC